MDWKARPILSEHRWRDGLQRGRYVECWNLCLALLENRWPSKRGQADRVAAAAEVVGRALHLASAQLRATELAARFHAIGLLGMPEDACRNAEQGGEAWAELVRSQTRLGARLIHKTFPDFPDAVEGIWYQQERFDGQGPYGLERDEIPIVAQIVGLITTMDQMINPPNADDGKPLAEVLQALERDECDRFPSSLLGVLRRSADDVYRALAPPPAPEAAAAAARPKPAAPVLRPPSLSDLSPLLTREELARVVDEGLQLRPLALAVRNVMAISASPQCSAADVADAMLQDQALSISILKLANSSAYARGRRVRNLREAVSRIGVKTARNVVMALDVFERFGGSASDRLDARLFCEHSLATGLLAGALARACGVEETDDYFLWGILHDLGRTILAQQLPDAYAKVCEAAEHLALPLEEVELRMLTRDHCHILRRALDHWEFPRNFIEPVVNHHAALEELKKRVREQPNAGVIVALADRLTHVLMLGSSGNDVIYPIDEYVETLGLTGEQISGASESVRTETRALKYSMLARADSSDWPDRKAELTGKLAGDICPICVSTEREINSYELLFEQLGPPEPSMPNLAIIYARQVHEIGPLLEKLAGQESSDGVGQLPVLLIGVSKIPAAVAPTFAGRETTTLPSPLRITQLIDACNHLVARADPDQNLATVGSGSSGSARA